MRSDKKSSTEKNSGFGFKLLGAVCILTTLVFAVVLFVLNAVPAKYIIPLIVVLLIINLLILKPLWGTHTEKNKGRIFSSVIAVLLILILGMGIFYISKTMGFFDKINSGTQTHNFYVVVEKDSAYEQIKDIDGETVAVMKADDEIYKEAQKKLQQEVGVNFDEQNGALELCQGLVKDKSEVIFLNSAFYDVALEEIEGFNEETTKIIGQIDIKVDTKETAKKVNVTEDAFNVYISGIDTTGSIGNVSRSDVNMIATVNPKTKKILLTSIPRDYYVELASKGSMDKLTHSGLYGIEETVNTVENLLGIDINYYVKVNFTTVISLVDTLGGVEVNSDLSFNAGGYSFSEGVNYLDGNAALAFARERYSFASGDRQRVKNQQAVITGIINKATKDASILLKYNDILASIDDNLETNMKQKEITALVKMQIEDMASWSIEKCSLDGSGKMTPVYSAPSQNVYVMVPYQDTVDEASALIKQVMKSEEE